ncbi:6335_t:CDS:2 [Acaulospora colombiana]|uniref:6335_t:CDS:1 n=1 Tax=Acaulospora colombiana TaxID=27376 RepID=A0ACA9MHS7_9GLOM|nr:6335_t:CDS:2 [Acaulospora colombiana]
MGELEPWMDENYIRTVWYQLGENVNVKFIRDKFTGANAGYCFVDFVSNAAAVKALSTVNGTPIHGTNRVFKLNWASGGGLTDRNRDDRGPEFSIFVGDLGPEVTEWMLVSVFQQRYPSCKSAKIMTDPMTGMSRGYGFVRFGDEAEQQRALMEMQGSFCGNRPMRISTATPKNKSGLQGNFYQQPSQQNPVLNQYNDPNNTTVFVGGLSGVNSEEELRSPQPPSPYNQLGGMTPTATYGAYVQATPVVSAAVTPTQPPILQSIPDPLEPVPIQRMNELYISNKEALLERMEGWRGIYAQ